MSLTQFFFPQVVKRFISKINSNVELTQFSGSLRLDMGGLTQSGEVIERIWQRGFSHLLPKDFTPKSILILGFGTGSAARLISRTWPDCRITGVEIDPVVVDIAKKHFNIDSIPHLTLHQQDAAKFVKSTKQKFNLTIVDCYQGDKIPQELQKNSFFSQLCHISKYVLVNRLFWDDYKKTAADFLTQIESQFTYTTTRTPSNLLISLSKKA